jgi:hypothetical protein
MPSFALGKELAGLKAVYLIVLLLVRLQALLYLTKVVLVHRYIELFYLPLRHEILMQERHWGKH